MSGYLLDTNVVSETTRSRPNPSVVDFLDQTSELWLASLVVHELEFGLRLMPSGGTPGTFAHVLVPVVRELSDRIIPVK